MAEQDAGFYTPEILEQLQAVPAASFSSYLMALAAHQRGFDVMFVRSLKRVARRWSGLKDTVKPVYFLVSDGRKTHSFNMSIGDLTPFPSSQLSRNKERTKEILSRAGVPVPPGITVRGRELEKAQAWMMRHPGAKFVLKPVTGSQGVGLHLGLSPREVLELVSIRSLPEMVLETQFSGDDYRIYVAGGVCVAAFQRWTGAVVGNGRDSILRLIERKNHERLQNWYFRDRLIDLKEVQKYLLIKGRRFEDVPVLGERVILADAANTARGGEIEDATHRIPAAVAKASVEACRVIGLPNGGVDIFHDPRTDQVTILELNARAQIGGHTMPSKGIGSANRVAEAIMLHYFPPAPGSSAVLDRSRILDFAPVARAFAAGAPHYAVSQLPAA
jgi:D-alanine-D-alanine ligase-like ATP-grasp enzyme